MTSKFGVRGKLFLISLALIVVGVVSSGTYLERELRALIEGQLLNELEGLAQTAREACADLPPTAQIASADALAGRLGRATKVRITILDNAGRVLGDSALSAEQIRTADNQSHKPEVQAVLSGQVGQAHRFSTTTGHETLYVAVAGPSHTTIVRAAMRHRVSLPELDRIERQILQHLGGR